jgi:hypothetical protein
MDDRLSKELRAAIDEHADSPELRELWLRVLGLQLLAEDLSQQEDKPLDPAKQADLTVDASSTSPDRSPADSHA